MIDQRNSGTGPTLSPVYPDPEAWLTPLDAGSLAAEFQTWALDPDVVLRRVPGTARR